MRQLITTLCLIALAPGWGCESGERVFEGTTIRSSGGSFDVTYIVEGESIPMNEPFDMTIWVDDVRDPGTNSEGMKLSVDAAMPHHRHGMNREPRVTSIGHRQWQVDGMLFHMPGYWEIYFDVTEAGRTERAQTWVEIE